MASYLKVGSINVNGLKNDKKRKTLLRVIKKENFCVLAIQESFLQEKQLLILEKE